MPNQEMEYGFTLCFFKRTEDDFSGEYGIFLRSPMGDFVISEKGELFKTEQVIFKHTEFAKNFEKLFSLSLCRFCRQENGTWEKGILINEGRIGIIDENGMIVLHCWDWRAENGFYIDITGFLHPLPIE